MVYRGRLRRLSILRNLTNLTGRCKVAGLREMVCSRGLNSPAQQRVCAHLPGKVRNLRKVRTLPATSPLTFLTFLRFRVLVRPDRVSIQYSFISYVRKE
jgi:hypothetical protein